VVGAKLKVGMGGRAAFFADVCHGWREVLACREELGLVVDPGVPEGCVELFIGLSSHFILLIDPKKGLSFGVLITACAKCNVLVTSNTIIILNGGTS
jgi:hypothetical protein